MVKYDKSQGIYFLGESVQGASHKRKNKPCQDAFGIRNNAFRYKGSGKSVNTRNEYYSGLPDDVWIVAVADGHGSDSCPYSADGSCFAVNTFCDLCAEYFYKYNQDRNRLKQLLQNESEVQYFTKSVEYDWKKRAKRDYHTQKKNDPPVSGEDQIKQELAIYKLYGTTLLGMVVSSDFSFAYQMGDGDIIGVGQNATWPVITPDKILGVETHSLSRDEAWKKAITTVVEPIASSDRPYMYMLSSDGMSNSFVSSKEFYTTCSGYLSALIEHGADAVGQNLKGWLIQTSEEGCGDDTTVAIAYYLDKNEMID